MSAELPVRKMSGDGLSICMDPIDFEMIQKQIYDAALDLNADGAQDSDPFVSDPAGHLIPCCISLGTACEDSVEMQRFVEDDVP